MELYIMKVREEIFPFPRKFIVERRQSRCLDVFSFLFSEFPIETQVLAGMKVTQCYTTLMINTTCSLLCIKGGKSKPSHGDKVAWIE